MPILYVFILFLACLPAQAQTELPADSSGTVYTIVEQQPEFVGGRNGLFQYVRENLRTPKENQLVCCVGKIYVRLLVGTDGDISHFELAKEMKGACEAWNNAVTGLVKNMPKWKSAVHQGKRVKCYYILPVDIRWAD